MEPIVLDGLLHRVLQPERLKVLLADVLDRSDDAETRRKDDLDRVRRERIAAGTRLRRLLELVEEGLMSPRDPIFGEKLAEGRAAITALTEAERSLNSQLGAGNRIIDDAAVERFGAMLRAEILGENADLRRSYVRMLVGNVSVNDNDIVVAGSKAVLETAAVKGDMTGATAVRGFDRKWCATQSAANPSQPLTGKIRQIAPRNRAEKAAKRGRTSKSPRITAIPDGRAPHSCSSA
jgi:site-specific DNA recombinase